MLWLSTQNETETSFIQQQLYCTHQWMLSSRMLWWDQFNISSKTKFSLLWLLFSVAPGECHVVIFPVMLHLLLQVNNLFLLTASCSDMVINAHTFTKKSIVFTWSHLSHSWCHLHPTLTQQMPTLESVEAKDCNWKYISDRAVGGSSCSYVQDPDSAGGGNASRLVAQNQNHLSGRDAEVVDSFRGCWWSFRL